MFVCLQRHLLLSVQRDKAYNEHTLYLFSLEVCSWNCLSQCPSAIVPNRRLSMPTSESEIHPYLLPFQCLKQFRYLCSFLLIPVTWTLSPSVTVHIERGEGGERARSLKLVYDMYPATAVVLYMLSFGIGVGTVPWLLLGELCPSKVGSLFSLLLLLPQVEVSFSSLRLNSTVYTVTCRSSEFFFSLWLMPDSNLGPLPQQSRAASRVRIPASHEIYVVHKGWQLALCLSPCISFISAKHTFSLSACLSAPVSSSPCLLTYRTPCLSVLLSLCPLYPYLSHRLHPLSLSP